MDNGTLAADMPILLVGDKSSKWQWITYFRDWVPEWPLYKVVMLDGDKDDVKNQLDVIKMIKAQVIVMNYDKLRMFENELRERGPYLMIALDEIRRIKNAGTQRNQAADAIESIFRVGLDGTPLTKEPNSLHGILSWLMPGPYRSRHERGQWPKMPKSCPLPKGWQRDDAKKSGCGSCRYFQNDWTTDYAGTCGKTDKRIEGTPPHDEFYHLYSPAWGDIKDFTERYCLIECCSCGSRKYEYGWERKNEQQWRCNHNGYTKVVGAIREEELKRRLFEETKIMTRIDRKAIKGMPEVSFQWELVEMTREQSKFYAQAEEGLLEWVSGEGEFQTAKLTNVLAQLSYLRSFTTIPPSVVLETLRNGGKMPDWLAGVNIPDSQNSGKTTWVTEFVQDYLNGEDKVIIFSEWARMTHDLLPRINSVLKDGQYAVEIHGGCNDKQRQAAQEAFNTDPLCKVIVCTPAANAGLNLHKGVHGNGILYVVNVDCSWLPSDLEQRLGRAQRFGFDGAGIVCYFLMSIKDNEGATIDSRMARRVMQRANVSDELTGTSLGQFFDIKGRSDVLDLLTGD
jgi:SNF2 family DNA or RNA helicase